jgi:hypothetical protein
MSPYHVHAPDTPRTRKRRHATRPARQRAPRARQRTASDATRHVGRGGATLGRSPGRPAASQRQKATPTPPGTRKQRRTTRPARPRSPRARQSNAADTAGIDARSGATLGRSLCGGRSSTECARCPRLSRSRMATARVLFLGSVGACPLRVRRTQSHDRSACRPPKDVRVPTRQGTRMRSSQRLRARERAV